MAVVGVRECFYPLNAFRITGEPDEVVNEAVAIVLRWREIGGPTATENILAVNENGVVEVYFVPRDKDFPGDPDFLVVGGLECLGEFVLSTEAAQLLLREQRLDFECLQRLLRSVTPVGAEALFGGSGCGRRNS